MGPLHLLTHLLSHTSTCPMPLRSILPSAQNVFFLKYLLFHRNEPTPIELQNVFFKKEQIWFLPCLPKPNTGVPPSRKQQQPHVMNARTKTCWIVITTHMPIQSLQGQRCSLCPDTWLWGWRQHQSLAKRGDQELCKEGAGRDEGTLSPFNTYCGFSAYVLQVLL